MICPSYYYLLLNSFLFNSFGEVFCPKIQTVSSQVVLNLAPPVTHNTQNKRNILNRFYKFPFWSETKKKKDTFSPESAAFRERNPEQQYPQRHGRIQLCSTLCKKTKHKKNNFFLGFIGQLKSKFTVGINVGLFWGFFEAWKNRNVQNGSLEENFLQTTDCIRGNFVFIANPVGLLSAASCCLFQFAIKEGNKSPHNRPDQLWTLFSNELSEIVLRGAWSHVVKSCRPLWLCYRLIATFSFRTPQSCRNFRDPRLFSSSFENLFPLKMTYSQTDSNACMIFVSFDICIFPNGLNF